MFTAPLLIIPYPHPISSNLKKFLTGWRQICFQKKGEIELKLKISTYYILIINTSTNKKSGTWAPMDNVEENSDIICQKTNRFVTLNVDSYSHKAGLRWPLKLLILFFFLFFRSVSSSITCLCEMKKKKFQIAVTCSFLFLLAP